MPTLVHIIKSHAPIPQVVHITSVSALFSSIFVLKFSRKCSYFREILNESDKN
jgi:hypothetical protein